MELYPLRFHPVYKDYIWGGDRIARRFGRSVATATCAESWEIADRPEGTSVVANGAFAGRTLAELVASLQERLVGRAAPCASFPLLVKLIDARETLSVQVHPDNESAKAWGGEPKTEMWYVLEAAPGSEVYAGFKGKVAEAEFRDAVARGAVADLLREIPVRSGEAVFVPGGRIHAIGAGCLLLEVQQNSNTTYRVYDWGRVGADGAPRELHLDQAVRVIRWDDTEAAGNGPRLISEERGHRIFEVAASPFFRTELLQIDAAAPLQRSTESFDILFVSDGIVEVASPGFRERAAPGTTYLVPAALNACSLAPVVGPVRVVRVRLP
jgi:mannose-6-phosphate isomerase